MKKWIKKHAVIYLNNLVKKNILAIEEMNNNAALFGKGYNETTKCKVLELSIELRELKVYWVASLFRLWPDVS